MKAFILVGAGIALTILCWGSYGPILHKGQEALGGNKLKPWICVGVAYFIVAIIVPAIYLAYRGDLFQGWGFGGISWSLLAGIAGALGALGIIIALSNGGKPIYVMPLVFGGAPVLTVFVSMLMSGNTERPNSFFFAGLILVVVGAAVVQICAPKKKLPAAGIPKTPASQPAGSVSEEPAE